MTSRNLKLILDALSEQTRKEVNDSAQYIALAGFKSGTSLPGLGRQICEKLKETVKDDGENTVFVWRNGDINPENSDKNRKSGTDAYKTLMEEFPEAVSVIQTSDADVYDELVAAKRDMGGECRFIPINTSEVHEFIAKNILESIGSNLKACQPSTAREIVQDIGDIMAEEFERQHITRTTDGKLESLSSMCCCLWMATTKKDQSWVVGSGVEDELVAKMQKHGIIRNEADKKKVNARVSDEPASPTSPLAKRRPKGGDESSANSLPPRSRKRVR